MNIRSLLPAIALCIGLVHGETYRPPNLNKRIFEPTNLKIDKINGSTLFGGLMSIAKDFDADDNVDYTLRAHALAIASHLKPDSPTLEDVMTQLKGRGSAAGDEGATKERTASKIYRGTRALLKKTDIPDNQTCAKYCVDLALRLKSETKDTKKLQELQEELGKPDWSGLLEPRPYRSPWEKNRNNRARKRSLVIKGGEAETLAATEGSVKIATIGNNSCGKRFGKLITIDVSAEKNEEISDLKLVTKQRVGWHINKAFNLIEQIVIARHSGKDYLPSNYIIELKFPHRKEYVDSPVVSAGLVLLIDSLITGKELDPATVITGNFSPKQTGYVTKETISAIQGAIENKAKILAIPLSKRPLLEDCYILNGLNSVLDTQFLSYWTLDEAISRTAKEKEEPLTQALAAFAELAKTISEKGADALKEDSTKTALQEILEKAPYHASAAFLLALSEDKTPVQLSTLGTIQTMDLAWTFPYLKYQDFLWSNSYVKRDYHQKDAEEVLSTMEAIKPKIAEVFHPYHQAIVDATTLYLETIKPLKVDEERPDSKRPVEIEPTWEKVEEAREELCTRRTLPAT